MTEAVSSPSPERLTFLVHREGDDVAVAVRDAAASEGTCACLDTGRRFGITARAPIPLGHKIALRDLAADEAVTEYGVTIGLARAAVATGDLVHTHNLRSARWRKSV